MRCGTGWLDGNEFAGSELALKPGSFGKLDAPP